MSDNVQKWREDFRVWFLEKYLIDVDLIEKDCIGGRRHGKSVKLVSTVAWEAFLMAKQNQPVVELPAADIVFDENDMPYEYYEPEIIHAAITAAGIPYKIKGE